MNMENNVGPSTEPCGTPAVIGQVGDNTPPTLQPAPGSADRTQLQPTDN